MVVWPLQPASRRRAVESVRVHGETGKPVRPVRGSGWWKRGCEKGKRKKKRGGRGERGGRKGRVERENRRKGRHDGREREDRRKGRHDGRERKGRYRGKVGKNIGKIKEMTRRVGRRGQVPRSKSRACGSHRETGQVRTKGHPCGC